MNGSYEEFLEKLQVDILDHKIDKDSRLPNEEQLQERYGVTRYSLRKAIADLVARGLLYQVQGSGIYLRKQPKGNIFSLDDTLGITLESKKANRKLETTVIHFAEIAFGELELKPQSIELPPNTSLYFVERLRIIDHKPFVVEYAYYLKDIVKYLNREIAEQSIYAYLQEVVGLKFGFADKRINAEKLTEEAASLLELNENDPTIVIRDQSYLTNGELFNFSTLCYHYEEAQFFMHASMR